MTNKGFTRVYYGPTLGASPHSEYMIHCFSGIEAALEHWHQHGGLLEYASPGFTCDGCLTWDQGKSWHVMDGPPVWMSDTDKSVARQEVVKAMRAGGIELTQIESELQDWQ